MARERHSYIAFYPSDWIAGTARMTPMHELVYFRVCLYNWDKAVPCPTTELPLMLGGVPDWRVLLLDLVQAGKLVESPDGSLANTRAVSAAKEAMALWEKKSRGGRTGAAKTNAKAPKIDTPDETPSNSAGETPDVTHDGTPAASDDGTRPGVPSHNQNHNHNQREEKTDSITAPPSASPSENNPVQKVQNVSREISAPLPDPLKADDDLADDPPPTVSRSRGTRLAADWAPSAENIEFCRAHRPDLDPSELADEFRDFWVAQPGQRGVKLNWDATWRNRVRNAPQGRRKPGQSRTMQALDDIERRFAS